MADVTAWWQMELPLEGDLVADVIAMGPNVISILVLGC